MRHLTCLLATRYSSAQAAVACAWDSGTSPCSIDAAYTYWGPKGPSLSGGTLVCGAVTVSPYLTTAGSKTEADTSAQTCGGGASSSPSATLAAAQSSANLWVDNEQIQCNDGFQDACQAIKQYEKCFSAAVKLAGQSAPFPPPGKTSSPTYDLRLLHSFASWIGNFEEPTTAIEEVLSDALSILDGIQTILDVSTAYNTCD